MLPSNVHNAKFSIKIITKNQELKNQLDLGSIWIDLLVNSVKQAF